MKEKVEEYLAILLTVPLLTCAAVFWLVVKMYSFYSRVNKNVYILFINLKKIGKDGR